MASSQFFALFDDIATLLDDVATMTKVASQKTAGVLGDDLALNAEQVAGVSAARELPVVWAVAKGSFINKLILVPSALLISAILPAAITPLLIVGGLYLCFEGAEKILQFFHKNSHEDHLAIDEIIKFKTDAEILAFEKEKIKGAIRTDFVLSAEIVVISLGVVAEKIFVQKALVLSLIAVAMTIGVYGLVALIVKLDDIGFYLEKKKSNIAKGAGIGLIKIAPKLMKSLSWIGLIAMFLVGGGILVHGLPFLHHLTENVENFKTVIENGFNFVVGLFAGFIVVGGVEIFKKLIARPDHKT